VPSVKCSRWKIEEEQNDEPAPPDRTGHAHVETCGRRPPAYPTGPRIEPPLVICAAATTCKTNATTQYQPRHPKSAARAVEERAIRVDFVRPLEDEQVRQHVGEQIRTQSKPVTAMTAFLPADELQRRLNRCMLPLPRARLAVGSHDRLIERTASADWISSFRSFSVSCTSITPLEARTAELAGNAAEDIAEPILPLEPDRARQDALLVERDRLNHLDTRLPRSARNTRSPS